MSIKEDWVRNAKVIKVVDGDTVQLSIDLGCRIWADMTCRLYGLNAREPRGTTKNQGLLDKEWLRTVLETSMDRLIVRVHKDPEKYGRWLVELFLGKMNVNQEMIASGHAVSWDGKGARPVFE